MEIEKVTVTKQALREIARDVLAGKRTVESLKTEAFKNIYSDEEDFPEEKVMVGRPKLDPKLRGISRFKPGHSSMRVKSAGDSIVWELPAGQTMRELAKELDIPLQKITKLNPEIKSVDKKYSKSKKLNLPELSLRSVGKSIGMSPSQARKEIALAFDKRTMSDPLYGAPPEVAALMEDLRDVAAYELQEAISQHLPNAKKAVERYINALGKSPHLDKEDLEILKNKPKGIEYHIWNLEGFRKWANKNYMFGHIITFRSPKGALLHVKPSGDDPGLSIFDAIEAFLASDGNLDDHEDVDVDKFSESVAVRKWMDQRDYLDWIRNVAEKSGYYGVDADKPGALKYDPESGIGQW